MVSKIFKKGFFLRKRLKFVKRLGLSDQFLTHYFKFLFHLTLYNFSKLFRGKVDDNLIVLGGNYGKSFGGNTKYLYFYLKENTNYKLFWVTNSKPLLKKLQEQGINAIPRYSLKTIRILRRARAVFVTHGHVDVLAIKYSPRTVFVQTWHGGDIKKSDISTTPYVNNILYSNLAKFLRLNLRYHQFFDYMLCHSKEEKHIRILAEANKFPIKRILPFGYPRNDIFFSKDKMLKENLRKKYHIENKFEKIILYAPTFRNNFVAKFPLSDEELLKLNNLMKETKTLFLLKAHMREKSVKFKEYENIRIVDPDSDIQELLYITEVLISDYSSVFLDFLLLNKPIILFPYDYDNYIKERGLNYNHLEEIAPGALIYSGDKLIDAIKKVSEIERVYANKRLQMRDYFNAYNDGNSSKRLLKFLKLI